MDQMSDPLLLLDSDAMLEFSNNLANLYYALPLSFQIIQRYIWAQNREVATISII